ncbi:MAG: FecR domain-containing protein [Leptospiraceae bacterium]|nr:FecR domain-containing protein [Leptospiraceae bacterium]MCP5493136.1 FecR domain-containing protein [Leptospiraceae bacterium]
MKKFLVLLSFFLSITIGLNAQKTIAVTTFVQGEVFYKIGTREQKVYKNQTFQENGIIITKKGKIDLQISSSNIIRLSENTSLFLKELSENSDEQKIELVLNVGKLYANITKKLKGNSSFKISTPTAVAGVRGTEFLVNEEPKSKEKTAGDTDIPTGFFVKKGEVELKVESAKCKYEIFGLCLNFWRDETKVKPYVVKEGQQVTLKKNKVTQGRLNLQIKQNMEKELETMKLMDSRQFNCYKRRMCQSRVYVRYYWNGYCYYPVYYYRY